MLIRYRGNRRIFQQTIWHVQSSLGGRDHKKWPACVRSGRVWVGSRCGWRVSLGPEHLRPHGSCYGAFPLMPRQWKARGGFKFWAQEVVQWDMHFLKVILFPLEGNTGEQLWFLHKLGKPIGRRERIWDLWLRTLETDPDSNISLTLWGLNKRTYKKLDGISSFHFSQTRFSLNICQRSLWYAQSTFTFKF